jgi:3-deoxy-D-manno-octulosonic acid kinase
MAKVDGFARRAISRGELWLADGFEHAVDELGLDQLSRWKERLSSGVPAGRGNVAFVETAQGPLVLKQLRRGGVAGPLWRERFPSRRRLLDNLMLPALARERGVRTPPAIALLLVPSGPALWRGWLAIQAVLDAVPLSERIGDDPPKHDEWVAALAAVRGLHDAGFDHPDLNLGNLLVGPDGGVWVIDLDRCRVREQGLEQDGRITGIRRIERSYHKTCFLRGVEPDPRIDWLELYSGGDRSLDLRWEQRRDRDLARLRRHRSAWKRPSL